MATFSPPFDELTNCVKDAVSYVVKQYNGKVMYEYTDRQCEVPIYNILATIGIESLRADMSSVSEGGISTGGVRGDNVEVKFVITYYCPIGGNGRELVEAFLQTADEFSQTQFFNCTKIECGKMRYDRNKRAAYMKTYVTAKYTV